MGVIKRGILGGFSGKVANVVGSSWKGIAVVRSLPLSVANPDTTAQRAQRGKFRGISQLASMILVSFVKPLWDAFAQQMSGYNAFIQANIASTNASGDLNPSKFVLSRGRLGLTEIVGAMSEGETKFTATWSTTPAGAFQSETDKLYLLLLTTKGEIVGQSAGVVSREAGTIAFSGINLAELDGSLFAVATFARADGSLVGDTARWEY